MTSTAAHHSTYASVCVPRQQLRHRRRSNGIHGLAAAWKPLASAGGGSGTSPFGVVSVLGFRFWVWRSQPLRLIPRFKPAFWVTRLAIAKLKARERDRRKDWVEKLTTDLAGRFDTIRIEALDVQAMTRSARGTVEQPGRRPARWAVARQSFWSGRADPGRLHVATLHGVRARRCRKPQEPSGVRLRSLHHRTVQRRRQRSTKHRRRTGGDSTGRRRR
jgi:hypothetical protein